MELGEEGVWGGGDWVGVYWGGVGRHVVSSAPGGVAMDMTAASVCVGCTCAGVGVCRVYRKVVVDCDVELWGWDWLASRF